MLSKGDARKIHWLSWKKLCWPKEAGGLGFRDLHTFNLVMLEKQGWQLMHNTDTLVARILKAKYFPHDELFQAQAGSNPYTHGIVYLKELRC